MPQFEKMIISELTNPAILECVKGLATTGVIHQSEHYCYLKIDDEYIHRAYPLLAEYSHIHKPDYFSPNNNIGAHISIIYPEEDVTLHNIHPGQIHSFTVVGFMKAKFGHKEYFVLAVEGASLTALRRQHQLSAKPVFKGHNIVFHTTIGVRDLL